MINAYWIPAGTLIYRLHGAAGPHGVTGLWYRFTSVKPVTYTEKDVVTHGTNDVGWVFKLPKAGRPYTHVAVKHQDVYGVER